MSERVMRVRKERKKKSSNKKKSTEDGHQNNMAASMYLATPIPLWPCSMMPHEMTPYLNRSQVMPSGIVPPGIMAQGGLQRGFVPLGTMPQGIMQQTMIPAGMTYSGHPEMMRHGMQSTAQRLMHRDHQENTMQIALMPSSRMTRPPNMAAFPFLVETIPQSTGSRNTHTSNDSPHNSQCLQNNQLRQLVKLENRHMNSCGEVIPDVTIWERSTIASYSSSNSTITGPRQEGKNLTVYDAPRNLQFLQNNQLGQLVKLENRHVLQNSCVSVVPACYSSTTSTITGPRQGGETCTVYDAPRILQLHQNNQLGQLVKLENRDQRRQEPLQNQREQQLGQRLAQLQLEDYEQVMECQQRMQILEQRVFLLEQYNNTVQYFRKQREDRREQQKDWNYLVQKWQHCQQQADDEEHLRQLELEQLQQQQQEPDQQQRNSADSNDQHPRESQVLPGSRFEVNEETTIIPKLEKDIKMEDMEAVQQLDATIKQLKNEMRQPGFDATLPPEVDTIYQSMYGEDSTAVFDEGFSMDKLLEQEVPQRNDLYQWLDSQELELDFDELTASEESQATVANEDYF